MAKTEHLVVKPNTKFDIIIDDDVMITQVDYFIYLVAERR